MRPVLLHSRADGTPMSVTLQREVLRTARVLTADLHGHRGKHVHCTQLAAPQEATPKLDGGGGAAVRAGASRAVRRTKARKPHAQPLCADSQRTVLSSLQLAPLADAGSASRDAPSPCCSKPRAVLEEAQAPMRAAVVACWGGCEKDLMESEAPRLKDEAWRAARCAAASSTRELSVPALLCGRGYPTRNASCSQGCEVAISIGEKLDGRQRGCRVNVNLAGEMGRCAGSRGMRHLHCPMRHLHRPGRSLPRRMRRGAPRHDALTHSAARSAWDAMACVQTLLTLLLLQVLCASVRPVATCSCV